MQLWTEYEGVIIDGAFPLKKLLMPEGRSAFFSTAGTHGEPTVLRLIECHFDEEEILSRWRSMEALNHPNFLKFERFGQTEIEGRPVVYAVFEKVDGNLAEVLDQGNLTVPDVAQLASSLVAALEVLHTHGFVHEHLEPRNIFALGEGVKLRSDCIREAPEGQDGRAAKQRDVRDLATVLLQALTQRQSLQGVPESALPPPFGQIIRNGLDGTWGLEDIRAALGRQFGSNQPAPTPSPTPSLNTVPTPVLVPKKNSPSAATRPLPRQDARLPLRIPARGRNAGFDEPSPRKNPWRPKDSWRAAQAFSFRSHWLAVSIAALFLILCLWLLARSWNAPHRSATGAAALSQSASASASQTALTPPSANLPRTRVPALAPSRPGWRVITFTYNRRADADKKVSELVHSHPELEPVVFTPSGHAPYLVSIGGVMDRDTAHALARKSRSLGLPRDMYAQNYTR